MTYIDIVFDGPPDHESGRFVEVEDGTGRSINAGEWIERPDGLWALRIKQAADVAAEEQVRSERSERANTSPALQAEVERLREGLETINRLTYPGNRTLDEMMRGMGLACDIARSLLTRSTEV